jgi:hypothetical protein
MPEGPSCWRVLCAKWGTSTPGPWGLMSPTVALIAPGCLMRDASRQVMLPSGLISIREHLPVPDDP